MATLGLHLAAHQSMTPQLLFSSHYRPHFNLCLSAYSSAWALDPQIWCVILPLLINSTSVATFKTLQPSTPALRGLIKSLDGFSTLPPRYEHCQPMIATLPFLSHSSILRPRLPPPPSSLRPKLLFLHPVISISTSLELFLVCDCF
jgi:hypothetical protein